MPPSHRVCLPVLYLTLLGSQYITSAQVKLLVAPLLSGSGAKGKISQAIKYGVPVVATSVAVEGMRMDHGTDVLVGDSAMVFADHLVQLYTGCELWRHVVDGGNSYINNHFSPRNAQLQLINALTEAGLPPRGVNGKHYC